MLQRDGGEDGVHDERTGGLALAHQAAQDVPMPLARLEDTGRRLGEPGRNRRFRLGRRQRTSKARGFVLILRKAHSVSQAKRMSPGPESSASSQTRLASCCSARG